MRLRRKKPAVIQLTAKAIEEKRKWAAMRDPLHLLVNVDVWLSKDWR